MLEKTTSYNDHTEEVKDLRAQLEEMRFQLEEANDTINAIRMGEVDALVVKAQGGHQLYTLKTADQTYRIFIEQMIEGAVTLNENGHILYCNSRFAELVHLSLEKVIGQSFFRFIQTIDIDICKELVAQAWKNNTKGELHLLAGNDSVIPVLLSLKMLHLDEGISLSIILTDLTQQKKIQELLQQKNMQLEEAKSIVQNLNLNLEETVRVRTDDLEKNIREKIKVEETLRHNQERLTGILETMAEGVAIIDVEGKITYYNPMAQKILQIRPGHTSLNIYYNPFWENSTIDGIRLRADEHPMRMVMKTGKPVYDCEIGIKPMQKELLYVSFNAAPVYDERGNITGSIGTFMDVTNRRRDIQQKDDFISVASHELKTPITTLNGYLQMLEMLKDDPSADLFSHVVEKANQSMRRVTKLVQELLNTSKITGGQWQLSKTSFALSTVVDDCSQYIYAGNFDIKIEGDKELKVSADFDRIGQVITNFINNAVKYAPTSKQIIVSISAEKDRVCLSVTDRGPGISPEKLPHLFERYYRVDNTGTQYSGLGLGLYISSEIIEKHGGEIGVESQLGKGSTFWFKLPA